MARAAKVEQTGSPVAAVVTVAMLAATFFVLAWGGIYLTREAGRVAAVWLPNAFLVAAILRHPGGWRPKVLACLFANILANLASGDSLTLAVGLACCNSFEVLAIIWCMRRFAPGETTLTNLRTMVVFSIAGTLAPAVAAIFATGLLNVAGGGGGLDVWATFAKADALGQIVVVPVLLIFADAWRAGAMWPREKAAEAAAIIGAVALICVVTFTQSHFPLIFIINPFILLAAFRLGANGAACAIIVVAVVSGVGTAMGTGPITLIDGGIADKLTVLQLFLAASFVSALPVAAALEQRMRLAEALERSEHLLGSITDNIRDVVFRADRQGRWLFLNPAWEQLTGRRIADSIGTPVDALIVPEDLEEARARFLSLFTGAQDEVQTDFRFQHTDGSIRWVETTIRRQVSHRGVVTGTIGSIRDITERQKQALAMAAREQELRLVTTHSADMIVRTGMDRVRRYASPASRTLLGYEPEEIINQEPFHGIHPDDLQAVEERCEQAIRKVGVVNAVYRQRHRDGHYVWVEASFSVIRDRNGTPREFISSVRDFGARRKLEDDLREALDRAQDAARLKASFLANMSHEIRTPMNGVIGFTELLLASDLNGEQRNWAGLIDESGRAMMTLLNDILDLSRIDADQIEIARETYDLHEAIAASVRLVIDDARQKGLVIDLLIDESVPRYVTGDGLRLGQILLNLLSNAMKFTEAGFIRLGACAVDGRLHLTVEDSGCGIAPDRQAAVFEQFVQADTSIARRYGGSGLGLAISQRLARLLGGEIALSKSNAQGTRMLLTLPLTAADGEAVRAVRALPAKARADVPVNRTRILVAEDAEINQLLIDALLTRHGHLVTIVGDGGQAVRAFTDAEAADAGFDLILMDIQMPEVDGLEATRRVRALGGRGASIPIVALTANAFASDVEACLEAGMDAHLPKPIAVEMLLATIARLTQRDDADTAVEAPADARTIAAGTIADGTIADGAA